MGNNPSSTSRPSGAPPGGSSSSASASAPGAPAAAHDSSRPALRATNRHPHPVHTQRLAAPPEPSLAQAQGSNARPKSMPPLGYTSASSIAASSSPASSLNSAASKPTDIKPQNPFPHPRAPPAAAAALPDAGKTSTSQPVAVPPSQPGLTDLPTSPLSPYADSVDGAAMVPQSSVPDMFNLTRPPRLPLPIEEEIHTPGSPIIAPADHLGEPVENVTRLAGNLARKSSDLSDEDDDDDDDEELLVDNNRPTVPTRIEWRRGGTKIYVTGTIFQWNRKHRLHPVEGQPGVFAATMNILPGTHHVRFLVDGLTETSLDLPTTVDFGNNLVNYIEVNADDAARPKPPAGGAGAPADAKGKRLPPEKTADSQADEAAKLPRTKSVVPVSEFRYQIPKYLADFDQPEESPVYQSAVSAIDKLPTPPSLPGFLGKPILNAAVILKDDNSVLNMPNHTVLNHLATSSIKNNTLAVSATTRYKNKYVTTIIYKPTGADEKD